MGFGILEDVSSEQLQQDPHHFAAERDRFSELEDALSIPANTLSTRFRDLTEAGLLERTAYDEVPPRVEYVPTEKARSIFPVFGHLHRWAMTYEL